jgi:hypothetical protein
LVGCQQQLDTEGRKALHIYCFRTSRCLSGSRWSETARYWACLLPEARASQVHLQLDTAACCLRLCAGHRKSLQHLCLIAVTPTVQHFYGHVTAACLNFCDVYLQQITRSECMGTEHSLWREGAMGDFSSTDAHRALCSRSRESEVHIEASVLL